MNKLLFASEVEQNGLHAPSSSLRLLIPFFIFFTCITFNVHAQECYWSSRFGGTSYDGGIIMGTDHSGKLYAAGLTQSQNCYFNTDSLQLYGFDQGFFVKYDESGNEVWIKKFTGPTINYDEGYISVRGIMDTIRDEILGLGVFYGAIYLPDTLVTGAGMSILVMKMDLDGNVIWARSIGSNGKDHAGGITYDQSGNIYVAGENEETAVVGNDTLPPGGFIAKYDPDGSLIWAKKKFRFSEFGGSEVITTTMCMSGDILYLSGYVINDTIIVDTITFINPPNQTTGNYTSAFIAAFDENGSVKWMKLAGGSQGVSGNQMCVDEMGNALISGAFAKTGIFDQDTLINDNVQDGFLAKYRSNGELVWVNQLHSSLVAFARGVTVDKNGGAYLSGDFDGTVKFGSDSLVSGSSSDMFLAHYDSAGIYKGVRHYNYGVITHFTLDPDENIYFAGSFEDTLSIGPNTFTEYGGGDGFVAKCSAITGLEEKSIPQQTQLLIYANPTTGKCNIKIPEDFRHEKNLVLQIFDNNGRMIQNIPVIMDQEKISFNISAQAKGMYNVILSNGKKNYSGKIIFQ